MSGDYKKTGNYELIFQEFANLLTRQADAQNKRDEKRAVQTAKDFKELTESVNNLTKSHIEYKKDQEFISDRMNRYEDNQKIHTAKIGTMSDTILLLSDGVRRQRGWLQRFGEGVALIATSVITAVIITKML